MQRIAPEFINLTPHSIILIGVTQDEKLTIPPSGIVARCTEIRKDVNFTVLIPNDSILACSKTLGDILQLPMRRKNTLYIASALAAQAAWKLYRRYDIVTIGDPVRDSDGNIKGARGICFAPEVNSIECAMANHCGCCGKTIEHGHSHCSDCISAYCSTLYE